MTLLNMAHPYALTRQVAREYLLQIRAIHLILTKDYGLPHELVEEMITEAKNESSENAGTDAEIEEQAVTLRAKLYAMQELESGEVKRQ